MGRRLTPDGAESEGKIKTTNANVTAAAFIEK
jgi:hypothetical protein